MTKFNIGDRVRLSLQADPDRREALGDMLGTIKEVHPAHYYVDWATPTPEWNGPNHGEVELAPSLVDDLRAKAEAKRAEGIAVRKEAEEAGRALDELTDRANTLARAASALTVAANVLEKETL